MQIVANAAKEAAATQFIDIAKHIKVNSVRTEQYERQQQSNVSLWVFIFGTEWWQKGGHEQSSERGSMPKLFENDEPGRKGEARSRT